MHLYQGDPVDRKRMKNSSIKKKKKKKVSRKGPVDRKGMKNSSISVDFLSCLFK